MKRYNLGGLLIHRRLYIVERQYELPTAALSGLTAFRMIHQNLPHGRAGDSEKMAAILIGSAFGAGQFEICLVDQRRRLESVALILSAPCALRHPMQLAIDDWHQLIKRILVSLAPGGKE